MDENKLKTMLKNFEGVKTRAYTCTAGRITIGVGRNLDDRGLSMSEIEYLLDNDVADVCKQLDKSLPWWRGLSENRQLVLADMCFNMGIRGLLGFTNTLKFIENGEYKEAAVSMLMSLWAMQVGRRANTLSNMMLEG